jgi:hypothetical protein
MFEFFKDDQEIYEIKDDIKTLKRNSGTSTDFAGCEELLPKINEMSKEINKSVKFQSSQLIPPKLKEFGKHFSTRGPSSA